MSEKPFSHILTRKINKQSPKELANEFILEAQDGNIDVLEVYAALKRLEKIAELTVGAKGNKCFKEEALAKVREYTKDNTSCIIHNADFKATATYTFWDFTPCNDPILISLQKVQEQVKELIAKRENELKVYGESQAGKLTLSKKVEVIENLYTLDVVDCGEEFKISPPVKKSRDGIRVTLK